MPARALLVAALLGLAAGPGCALRALHEPASPQTGWSLSAHTETHGHQPPKHQFSPPAPGLPQECLTYRQRFKHQYYTGSSHSHMANARHRRSKYVVLLKLHRVYEDRMPLDIILNARAMAAEVTEAGYNFYMLYQPPFDGGETLTLEEALEVFPFDLRQFLIVHDYADDFAQYHELGARDDPEADTSVLWGPGPRAPYTAVTRFMRRYRAYEYAWVVEYDVRWTGSSWGELLSAALDLARQATPEELSAIPGRLVDQERVASRALPASTEGLPDLLTFDGITKGDKWRGLPHNMQNSTAMHEMWGMLYLGSRRLWDAVHEYSSKGIGSHLETALATIAAERGFKAASIQLPRLNETYPELYHCCFDHAALIYAAWHNDSARCAPSLVLHSVKTWEPWWPGFGLEEASKR